MSKLEDKDYIHNLKLCFIRIEYYLKGMSELEFYGEPKTRDAVSYCLLNFGQSLNGLSESTKKTYKGIPSWFGFLGEPNTFGNEELWDILKNKEVGLLQYSDLINEMYEVEINGIEKTEKKSGIKSKKVEYIWDYKYPIKTKSSIWTVKKK